MQKIKNAFFDEFMTFFIEFSYFHIFVKASNIFLFGKPFLEKN